MADGISLRLNDATGLVSGKKGSDLHFFALDLSTKEAEKKDTEKVNGIEPDKQIYIDYSQQCFYINPISPLHPLCCQ